MNQKNDQANKNIKFEIIDLDIYRGKVKIT